MATTMKRVALGLGLLPVVALVVVLAQGAKPQPALAQQGEADKPAAKQPDLTPARDQLDQPQSGGVSTREIAPQAMKVAASGQYVRAYPKDSLKQLEATEWFVERPFAVERVSYDDKTRELLVAVNYGWNNADSDRFREALAEKYRQAGRVIEPKALSIMPLEMTGYSILIRDGDRDYLAFSTAKPTSVSAETIAFRVPATEADTLHQRLSDPKTLPSVKVVLRAGYSFERIVGLSVEKRAINAVWQQVLDSVRPNDAANAAQVLVSRKMAQEMQKQAVARLVTFVKTYGIPSGEEAAELEKAKGVMASVPVSPVTVLELLAMEESAWMYTLKAVQKDITPDEMNNALTKLKEVRSRAEKKSKAAESISDHANDSSLTLDQFYNKARKEAITAGGGGWGVSVNFHLDKDESEVMKNHSEDIKKARAYTSNKTNFTKDVQEFASKELEGVMNESKVTAKLLDLHRVSSAALTSQAGETYSYSRVTGCDTVFADTAVPLAPSPVVADAVAALQEDVGRLRADLKQRESDHNATAKALAEATKQVKSLEMAVGTHSTELASTKATLKVLGEAKAAVDNRLVAVEQKTQFIKIVQDEKNRSFMRIQLNPDMQIDFQYTGNVVVWGLGVLFKTGTYKVP